MAEYPTGFVEQTELLPQNLGPELEEMVDTLHLNKMQVRVGLTEFYAGSLAVMSRQPPIRKYFPEDSSSERFQSRGSIERWLAPGRRAVFLMFKGVTSTEQQLAGYGWSEANTFPYIEGAETMLAVRMGEPYQQQKRFTYPFASLIVGASRQLYGARHFWLQAWESDPAVVRGLAGAGFETVHQAPVERVGRGNARTADTKLYMRLPEPGEEASHEEQ
jgi:hypothetical protein